MPEFEETANSLDFAQEAFRANPTALTAATYRDAALDYWTDEMIGDETLIAALRELRDTTLER